MTPQEAVDALRAAKLYVRNLGDRGEIVGGSYVDRSMAISVVQDAFMLRPDREDQYEVSFMRNGQLDGTYLPLEEAVALVIKTIPPGTDIPAPPPKDGPQYY